MRAASVTPEALAAEVAGTSVGDTLVATVWRGGAVVAGPLDVTSWSIDWNEAGSSLSLVAADPDGDLAPWALDDPLGPGGSRIAVVYRFGATGTTVPLGWWRLRSSDPVEQWRVYDVAGSTVRVPGGGAVTVTAEDETCSVELDRLDPGSRVPVKANVLDEVTRLVEDYMAVTVDAGVTDRAVPSGLTYDEGRMSAVTSLLDTLDAAWRMSGERVLQVVPAKGVASGWTIQGGDDGALISLARSLSDDGVYNGVISTGQTSDGAPLVGRAYVTAGPLAWGGDYGRVPLFHSAVANTTSGVQKDAETLLASRQAAGEVDLSVECLTHPGIQVHDIVTVIAATKAGDQSLTGRVVGMKMGSAQSEAGTTPAKRMTLTVAVPRDALEAIGRRVSNAR